MSILQRNVFPSFVFKVQLAPVEISGRSAKGFELREEGRRRCLLRTTKLFCTLLAESEKCSSILFLLSPSSRLKSARSIN